MNPFQRKYARTTRTDKSAQRTEDHGKEYEIEEVFPPKIRRPNVKIDKIMTNRCCSVYPSREDRSQETDCNADDYEYRSFLPQQHNIDPVVSNTIKQLQKLRETLYSGVVKVEKASQYMRPNENVSYSQIKDRRFWQNVDSTCGIDHIMNKGQEGIVGTNDSCRSVHITDAPRIKVIAEKFSRLKKNDIELRKLEEKIVCVEYDIFRGKKLEEPFQNMRAYFSIKPNKDIDAGNIVRVLPSIIQHQFQITTDDLNKLNEKEIEIIDNNSKENKSYVDDLKNVLLRKRTMNVKKNKSRLDLKYLYQMAIKEGTVLNENLSNINLLPSAMLEEIKQELLNKLQSSPTVNRTIFKRGIESITEPDKHNNIYDSFFAALNITE